ncbi:cupin domain-containing protein [Actinoplanes sp. NPDC049599]|uniref:cupin domain-containing protein n=1 Tax=Actinoplanes sp. NPDC049599 TaxID=3363903 RepID=UPI0037A9B176
MSHRDPTVTDPALYQVLFENERVRVLQYRDEPGDRTHAHAHPDSVMVTLNAFRRRVSAGDRSAEVELRAGEARWLDEQEHTGENIGDTASHSIFVELKEPRPASAPHAVAPLGPSGAGPRMN